MTSNFEGISHQRHGIFPTNHHWSEDLAFLQDGNWYFNSTPFYRFMLTGFFGAALRGFIEDVVDTSLTQTQQQGSSRINSNQRVLFEVFLVSVICILFVIDA